MGVPCILRTSFKEFGTIKKFLGNFMNHCYKFHTSSCVLEHTCRTFEGLELSDANMVDILFLNHSFEWWKVHLLIGCETGCSLYASWIPVSKILKLSRKF